MYRQAFIAGQKRLRLQDWMFIDKKKMFIAIQPYGRHDQVAKGVGLVIYGRSGKYLISTNFVV